MCKINPVLIKIADWVNLREEEDNGAKNKLLVHIYDYNIKKYLTIIKIREKINVNCPLPQKGNQYKCGAI